MDYLVAYEYQEDCLWVNLIRTFAPEQFQQVMDFLVAKAKERNLPVLRGNVSGMARLRLFTRKGWYRVATIGHRYIIEFSVKKGLTRIS